MIIELLIKIIYLLIEVILNILPDIPSLPIDIIEPINLYIDIIVTNGLGLFYLLVRPVTVNVVIVVVVFLNSFEYIYAIIMWVLKKIPFLNIK